MSERNVSEGNRALQPESSGMPRRIAERAIRIVFSAVLAATAYPVTAVAQVPNPGFETSLACPQDLEQFDNYVADWVSASIPGTPDYYNSCCSTHCRPSTIPQMGVPHNMFGDEDAYDAPAGGHAYAGIYCSEVPEQWREYIKVDIPELTGGKWYTVKFQASLAEISSFALLNLGAYIGRNSPVSAEMVYPASPQVAYRGYLTTQDGWEPVSGPYHAQGGENSLIIGCFDPVLDTLPVSGSPVCQAIVGGGAYYYIDGISVEEVPEPPPCTSCAFDLRFEKHIDSDCCFSVRVTGLEGACPLYGVKAFLPSSTAILNWSDDSHPVLAGETRIINENFCLPYEQDSIAHELKVTFLGAPGTPPLCSIKKSVTCDCSCHPLQVDMVFAGSMDNCCYEVFVDNESSCKANASAVDLVSTTASIDFLPPPSPWTSSRIVNGQRLEAPSFHEFARNSRESIGTFCTDYSDRPSLFLIDIHGQDGTTCRSSTNIFCTDYSSYCCEGIDLDFVSTSSGCVDVYVSQNSDVRCKISDLDFYNRLAQTGVSWRENTGSKRHPKPIPIPTAPAKALAGTLCADDGSASTLSSLLASTGLTFWDENGFIACNLLFNPIDPL